MNMSYCEGNITEQCVNSAGSEQNQTLMDDCLSLLTNLS